jgi:sucrose-6-phosphate hydrolase SacC (GH32 family)
MRSLKTLFILSVALAIIPALKLNAQDLPKEAYIPNYHYYPSGDPSGLFYLDGFYYNNWGVARSKDFIHWQETEFGKRRNTIIDKLKDSNVDLETKDSLRRELVMGGSGTIVLDQYNKSGLGSENDPPLLAFWHKQTAPWNIQAIGISYSTDSAKSWSLYNPFPVLDINSREFRDPKVFWHEPSGKWVMAICWADVPKIQFYGSTNLKDWEYLSDFGPWGATDGVWECVDLFELPVDDDPSDTRWVMVISVQPLSGQYFIGEFDGTRFTLDPAFRYEFSYTDYVPDGNVIFDFEQGIDAWQMQGDAFIQSPSNQALFRQGAIMGQEGDYFINSYHNRAQGTGEILSPEFTIEKDFINFLVGGGYYPETEKIELLIKNKAVRSETGNHSGGLQWKGWDVKEFKGKKAQIRISDQQKSGAGYIYVDHIVNSDLPAVTDWEKAFWVDYGQDFYAARAWNNYAKNENRIVWTGWMGSWRYGGAEPIRGVQAVPRQLKLKTFPEGIRLIQKPIGELETLRKNERATTYNGLEGKWKPKKLQPEENSYEFLVEFDNRSAQDFGVELCVGTDQRTIVGIDATKSEVYVDRRNSGYDEFIGLFSRTFRGPLRNTEKVKLHVFIDKCSIEVFANDGETVISSKIYPDPGSTSIKFFAHHGEVDINSAKLWELSAINKASKEVKRH